MRDLGQNMTISDLWHCILAFRRSSEVTDLGRPILTYGSLIGGFGVSWGPLTKYVVHFSHRPVLKASLPFQTSIGDFRSLCPRVIFPVSEAFFPYGMLYKTNIRSRYRNNTSFCSKFNGEHVGEGFVRNGKYFSWIWPYKVEKLPISRKFDVWYLITCQILN